MNQYEPARAPDPERWLELDEQERSGLVEQFHRDARIKLPSFFVHSAIHVSIENQIAQGLESVVRAMARLTKQGLTRHEALHAIGNTLSTHIYDQFNLKNDAATSQARYNAAVETLTAKKWRKG